VRPLRRGAHGGGMPLIRSLALALAIVAGCQAPPDLGTAQSARARPGRMLTTPGYGSLAYYVRLESDRPLAMYLGQAGRQLEAGDLIGVGWEQGIPAPVGWAEVAIAAGDPSLGATSLRVVGALDIATPAQTVLPHVQIVRGVPLTWPVGADDSLWVVFASWRPPGWDQAPMLMGSSYQEPIQGSTVLELDVPGWKPSTEMAADRPIVFGTTTDRPVAAAAILP
jgi:hypothetical protein